MLTPIKAIRARCLDCCGGQKAEVRLCPSQKCPLWPYRMGAGQRMGKPMRSGPEMEKLPASPHILGKCETLGKHRACGRIPRFPRS